MTTHVAIVLYDGFDELDAVGPYEVFSAAADRGCDLAVSLRTLAPTGRVTASHGLTVEPDGVLPGLDADSADDIDDAPTPDLVVVPGGGWNDRADASAWAEAQKGDLPEAVTELYDQGSTVAAVCTGGMLLAEAGLLDGRPAVTHSGAIDDLQGTDAEVVDARVVDDGDVLTAGGVTSGLDLALHLVERYCGASTADEVATVLEYDRRGDVHRSDDA